MSLTGSDRRKIDKVIDGNSIRKIASHDCV